MKTISELRPVEYGYLKAGEKNADNFPIFLIGPIKWAADWQKQFKQKVTELIKESPFPLLQNIMFVDPRRVGEYGNHDLDKQYTPWYENEYHRQRVWELYHIDLALKWWIVAAWGAPQIQTLEDDEFGMQTKAYGATTRQELGIFCGRGMHEEGIKDRLVVWFDERFPEASTAWCDFTDTFGEEFQISGSLDDLAKRTVEKIFQLT